MRESSKIFESETEQTTATLDTIVMTTQIYQQ